MRAKTINEEQNFERGLDPKQSMDIGGIDFSKQLGELVREWEKNVGKSVLGKTITAIMYELRPNGSDGIEKTQTITVTEIDNLYTLGMMGANNSNYNLIVETDNGKRYCMGLDQKIYIK